MIINDVEKIDENKEDRAYTDLILTNETTITVLTDKIVIKGPHSVLIKTLWDVKKD